MGLRSYACMTYRSKEGEREGRRGEKRKENRGRKERATYGNEENRGKTQNRRGAYKINSSLEFISRVLLVLVL